jgi:pimeloyl-ACP methyl ester carboxylesterase
MELNYKKLGEGQPLIILHGLFGSLDNWMTLSRKIAENYTVYILDARNHGFSFHHDDFDYDVMTVDLYNFIKQHNLEEPIVLGHSMGGKTAMQFAMNYPHMLSRLIVADIAPKQYPVHHTTIIEGMYSLDFDIIKSRKHADEELSKHIPDLSTRQFILKNLHWKEKGKLAWKFNLPVISKNIETIGKNLNHNETFDKPTLFIRGEKSNYIIESDYPEIRSIFTKAKIESINSGHWVHAERPVEFLKILEDFLE